jgi:FkbM family methyltransferase
MQSGISMFKEKIMYLRTLGLTSFPCLIKAEVTNSTVYFQLDREDCNHPFELRIPSSDVKTYKQIFINQHYDFLVEKQPAVIVDAGANIGLASIYLANKFPDAMIIAMEPEQNNFMLLKKNTSPYPNIIPVQAALWNKNEEINLVDPGLGEWGFRTEMQNSSGNLSGKLCHTVMGRTIDNIMRDYGLTKIDILKVDIEGAEREVFNDTSSWIGNIDSIIIELHERFKAGCNDSFYCGSKGFDNEWKQGENIYLSKRNYLKKRSP